MSLLNKTKRNTFFLLFELEEYFAFGLANKLPKLSSVYCFSEARHIRVQGQVISTIINTKLMQKSFKGIILIISLKFS